MNLSLKGKKAMVCGGSQGIGKAAAAELALLGAEIVLVARHEDTLREAAGQLDTSHGQKHAFLACDFGDPAALKATVEAYLKKSGPVRVVAHPQVFRRRHAQRGTGGWREIGPPRTREDAAHWS